MTTVHKKPKKREKRMSTSIVEFPEPDVDIRGTQKTKKKKITKWMSTSVSQLPEMDFDIRFTNS